MEAFTSSTEAAESLVYTNGFTGRTIIKLPKDGRVNLPTRDLTWNDNNIPEFSLTIMEKTGAKAIFIFPSHLIKMHRVVQTDIIQHPAMQLGSNRRLQLNPYRKVMGISGRRDTQIVLRGHGAYVTISTPENENIVLDAQTLIGLVPAEYALDVVSSSLADELAQATKLLRILADRQTSLDGMLELRQGDLSQERIEILIREFRRLLEEKNTLPIDVDLTIAGIPIKGTLKIG